MDKDGLSATNQSDILSNRAAADLPQPVDYGLTYYDLTPDERGLTVGISYKKRGKWHSETFINILFYACTVTFIAYIVIVHQNLHAGDYRIAILVGLGLAWLLSAILLGFLPDAIATYKRRHPSAGLLAYRRAVCLHKLYVAAAREAEYVAAAATREAERAAHEAEQALLRQKRSYWERLNGYEFEIETAEVLKRHQFNPKVTGGSADGGVDIEVTRAGHKGVVQCKAHVTCVGPHIVRDLFGVMHHGKSDFGIIVSRGGFTKGAIDFARDKPILFLATSDLIAMQEGRDVLAAAFAPRDADNASRQQ